MIKYIILLILSIIAILIIYCSYKKSENYINSNIACVKQLHNFLPKIIRNLDNLSLYCTLNMLIHFMKINIILLKINVIYHLQTIPSRLTNDALKPIIDSFINQTIPADNIIFNIPFYSKRKQINYPELPNFLLQEPYKSKVLINRCDDYGPGTKIIRRIRK